MKTILTVAMTAGFVLTAAGVPASAQDEKIAIEGLLFVDRDGDRLFDADESPKAGIVVKAVDLGTREVRQFTSGADGRYRAQLPKGPKYSVGLDVAGDYALNRSEWVLSESRTDADFALSGYFVSGFTFVDANGDGVKQDEEKTHGGKVKVTGKAVSGAEVNAETEAGPDGAYHVDLPIGDFTLVAPDLTASGLTLAKPRSTQDADWLTGTYKVHPDTSVRNERLDLRYFEPKADIAVGVVVTPATATYTVGDRIEIEVTLSNKGDVPVTPSVVMAEFAVKLLSHSDNVKLINGRDYEFETVGKILPGGQVKAVFKVELNDVTFDEVWPIARFNFGRLKDVDHKNNVVRLPVKVVEKSITAEPSTPPSSSQTTAPTTTTTPAVAKAGNKSGLASTGASPLGFVALGGLLLVAGAGVFLAARRRRS